MNKDIHRRLHNKRFINIDIEYAMRDSHNGILWQNNGREEQTVATPNNMDATHRHNVGRKQLDAEESMHHDSIYTKFKHR